MKIFYLVLEAYVAHRKIFKNSTKVINVRFHLQRRIKIFELLMKARDQ